MAELNWYENINLESIKNIIKDDINAASRSFVSIGYFLKNVRDRELYIEDGYQNIWEFAKCEFGIGKSSACSFMAINDKFSVNGNSPTLLIEYRNFSSSKLSEMLTLTDEQLKQITETTTVAQIREIKKPRTVLTSEQELHIDKSIVASQQEPKLIEYIDFTRSVNSLAKEYESKGSCPPTIHSCIRGDVDGDEGKKLCTECWKKYLEQEKVLAYMSKVDELEKEDKPIEIVLEDDVTTIEIIEGVVEKSVIVSDVVEQFVDKNKLEEKTEQPELPALRNNEQRKEFIEAYETWPMWIDISLTQERYYRYDFDNGTSFVIRISMVHKWDKGKYSKEAEWGREEYFLLGEVDHSFPGGKSFTESSTNKSYMIEYLKNIQKK